MNWITVSWTIVGFSLSNKRSAHLFEKGIIIYRVRDQTQVVMSSEF